MMIEFIRVMNMNREVTEISKIKLGDHVRLLEDKNDVSKVIWHVIDSRDDRFLLLSDNLDSQGIFADRDDSIDKVTDYSDSKARRHAISFFDTKFSDNTKAHVLVDEKTGDKIHLLSSDEFNSCEGRVDLGKYTNGQAKEVNWWLRDLADMKGDILYVDASGNINYDGMMPENGTLYYRFAVWVDLDLVVERITSPFKFVKPTNRVNFDIPRVGNRCAFPRTSLFRMILGGIICYEKEDYIVRDHLNTKLVDNKKVFVIRVQNLNTLKMETIEIAEDDEVYVPDFRRNRYIYIGDDETRSFFMPVNGMNLFVISKEYRDMFLGQCPTKILVNLCFVGDNPIAMEYFVNNVGFVRL